MNDDLAGLTDGSLRPGIYRVPAGELSLPERLAAAGWQVAEIDPSDDLEEFYDQISEALAFPGYFGRNLDALWDCLTDLTEPTVLIIWSPYQGSVPATWTGPLSVLEDRTEEGAPFAIVLAAT